MLCSISRNNIGDKGATTLAAILKETMISDLECAATRSVFAFVSAPTDKSAHTDKNANTLWQPISLSPAQSIHVLLIPLLCALVSQCCLQQHHG